MVSRFRQKPVDVEAVQFDGTNGSIWDAQEFDRRIRFQFHERPTRGGKALRPMLIVPDLEAPDGFREAFVDDWIVKYDDGELGVFTNEAFHEAFNPVDEGGDDGE